MRRAAPLENHQIAVLQWIVKGSPPDQMVGTGYKRTASALQDRCLVKIIRTSGTWTATITERGRY
jgi:hypothetical protein